MKKAASLKLLIVCMTAMLLSGCGDEPKLLDENSETESRPTATEQTDSPSSDPLPTAPDQSETTPQQPVSEDSANDAPVTPASVDDGAQTNLPVDNNSGTATETGSTEPTDIEPTGIETTATDQPSFTLLRLRPPLELQQSTALDVNALYPRVLLGEQNIEMTCCDSDNYWTGEFFDDLQSQRTLSAVWYEDFEGAPLELASLNIMISTTTGTDSISVGGGNYSTNIDTDGDAEDNLTEREQNTNPNDLYDTNNPLYLADVLVPRLDQAQVPVVDGAPVFYVADDGSTNLAGEWQPATQNDRNGQRLDIGNVMIDTNGTGLIRHNHHWAMAHDGTWLYLLAISDDAGQHSSDSDEDLKIWKDDDLEIFFDGNNSKLASYDGVDDFHIHINLTERLSATPNRSENTGARFFQALNSATIPNDFRFSTGLQNGPVSPRNGAGRQDIYEIRFRLSELNISVGALFGFEIQLNDDDDGGDRDTKWGWKHPAGTSVQNDLTWRDPSYMGTVLLLP